MHIMLGTLKRSTDAKRLNEIVNHPKVHPWVSVNGEPLDLSATLESADIYALLGSMGGVTFHRLQPGLFDAHTHILPDGRGQWGLAMVEAALHWLFTRTEAVEVMTRCPKGNLAAKALARAIGGTCEFINPHGWVKDNQPIPADIYALRIQDWMRRAPGLVERGRWFHDRLKAELAMHGRTEPPHPEDGTHDRYVGAACEMIFGGAAPKGILFYNRWAVMAGYVPIAIAAVNPLTIDIGSALLVMRDDDFWVPSVTPLS